MAFEYLGLDEAMARGGLRMVVVGNVPSPWGEAAKGLFHIKGLDWSAVRLVYDDPALADWAGELSGPVAIWKDESPRSAWNDILLLAERLAPAPALIPADAGARAMMFGLSHELIGPGGLASARRLQLVHGGLTGQGGFASEVAQYLAGKYGHTPQLGEAAGERVRALLEMLVSRLRAQKQAGSPCQVGDTLSAADV